MDEHDDKARSPVNIRMTAEVQRKIYLISQKVKKESGFLPTRTAVVEKAITDFAEKMGVGK